MIPEGGTMELIAPHEPRPLRQEFRQQYGNSFAWEVVENRTGTLPRPDYERRQDGGRHERTWR